MRRRPQARVRSGRARGRCVAAVFASTPRAEALTCRKAHGLCVPACCVRTRWRACLVPVRGRLLFRGRAQLRPPAASFRSLRCPCSVVTALQWKLSRTWSSLRGGHPRMPQTQPTVTATMTTAASKDHRRNLAHLGQPRSSCTGQGKRRRGLAKCERVSARAPHHVACSQLSYRLSSAVLQASYLLLFLNGKMLGILLVGVGVVGPCRRPDS